MTLLRGPIRAPVLVTFGLISLSCSSGEPTGTEQSESFTLQRNVRVQLVSQADEPLQGRQVTIACRIEAASFSAEGTTDSSGSVIKLVHISVRSGSRSTAECEFHVDGEQMETASVDLSVTGVFDQRIVIELRTVSATVRLALRGTGSPGDSVVVTVGSPTEQVTKRLAWGDSWPVPPLVPGEYSISIADGIPNGCISEPGQSWHTANEWDETTGVIEVGLVCVGEYVYEKSDAGSGLRSIYYVDDRLEERQLLASGNVWLLGWGRSDDEVLIRDNDDCSIRALGLEGNLSEPLTDRPARHGAMSHDGRYLAIPSASECYGARDRGMRIVRTEDDALLFFEAGATRFGGSWSRDGVFAYATDRNVILWHAETERPEILRDFGDFADLEDRVTWSPDGSRILVHRQEVHRLVVISASTGEILATYDPGEIGAALAHWHPSGLILDSANNVTWDPRTGETTPLTLFGRVDHRAWFGEDDGISSQGSGFAYHAPLSEVWTQIRDAAASGSSSPGLVLVRRSASEAPW